MISLARFFDLPPYLFVLGTKLCLLLQTSTFGWIGNRKEAGAKLIFQDYTVCSVVSFPGFYALFCSVSFTGRIFS